MKNHELTPLLSLLGEIKRLAEDGEITGSLDSGRPTLIRRYNTVLAKLAGQPGADLFEPLGESATFGEIMVDAALLLKSVQGEEKKDSGVDLHFLAKLAPFTPGEDLAKLAHKHLDAGHSISPAQLEDLAPFMRGEDLTALMDKAIGTPPDPRARLAEILADPNLSPDQKLELAMELAGS